MVNLIGLMEILPWDSGWGVIISWFSNGLGDFGLAIVIFTICLKFIMSPLEFFQRKVSKKQAGLQKKMAPELEKVKAKYADRPEVLRQKLNDKQMELYKKENFNIGSSCLIMIINMAVTFAVFLTLFNALNFIGKVETYNSFQQLQAEYNEVLVDTGSVESAEQAVVALYDSGSMVQSFLWIDNIWKSDTSANSVMSYQDLMNTGYYADIEEGDVGYVSEATFNAIMQPIVDTHQGWNGYYILVILAGAISYLSAVLSSGGFKKQIGEDGQPIKVPGGKIMKILLPCIMVLITLFYNALFSLYIVTNALFSLVTIPIYNKIFDVMDKKKKDKNEIEVEYKIKKFN